MHTQVSNWQEIGSRKYQEDTFVHFSHGPYVVGAVFDGHGGDYVSQYCKHHFAAAIAQASNSSKPGNILPLALQSLEREMESDRNAAETGSTASAFLYDRETGLLFTANLGDSPIYLLRRGTGECHRMFSDGRWSVLTAVHQQQINQLLAESGYKTSIEDGYVRLNGDNGCYHGLAVSSALGDECFKSIRVGMDSIVGSQPASFVAAARAGDLLLLASDGVSDGFSPSNPTAWVDYVAHNRNRFASSLAREVVQQAASRPLSDNSTLLMVTFS